MDGREPTARRSLATARAHAPLIVAAATAAACLAVYAWTLLPGVSIGDSAEFQHVPYELGIPHPTGFPSYVLLLRLFEVLPVGSLAWRANFFSACAAGLAVATTILILRRAGVRPAAAAAAAGAAAFSTIVWNQATLAEVSTLHLALVLLVVHRALVWRDSGRPRDLYAAAMFLGVDMGAHLLGVALAPIAAAFVGWAGRRSLSRRPVLVAGAVACLALGLSTYAYIPVRALFGPPDVYGHFLTPSGFTGWVTGAMFRGDMHFLSPTGLAAFLADLPRAIGLLSQDTHPLFLLLALPGLLLLARRQPALTLYVAGIGALTLYLAVNYLFLERYMLVTVFALAIGAGAALGALLAALERVGPGISRAISPAALGLPLLLAVSHGVTMAAHANDSGQALTTRVFAQLPPDAALATYWDATGQAARRRQMA